MLYFDFCGTVSVDDLPAVYHEPCGMRHYNCAIIYGEFVYAVLFFLLTPISSSGADWVPSPTCAKGYTGDGCKDCVAGTYRKVGGVCEWITPPPMFTPSWDAYQVGLGRVVALYYCSSTLYQIH